jgi:hypothetical protein
MKVKKMTNTSKDNDFPLTICDEVRIDLKQIPTPITGQIDYIARDINNKIFCQFDFEIVATEEVEGKRQEVVGRIHLIGLNNAVRRMEQVSLEDAYEMSDAARECYKAITNKDGDDYKESFKSKLNSQHNLVGGLLFVDMIGVNIFFQKFDVSLDILDTICTMFQPFYDAILIAPSPVQYLTICDREDPVYTTGDEFGDVNKKTAKRKLVKHFEKAGFELFESKYVMLKKL